MQVRVLGAIGVVVDGDAELGGPTQRRTLAMLLLRVNQVVQIDQFVDAVWPDGDAPERAEHNVRTYVHRLRGSLGRSGDRIETVGSGYKLRLGRHELDTTRFEDLLAAARVATGDGDQARAEELLDSALDLWRGRPYDEFADEEWVRPEVVRLTELKASAIEHRFAALLDAGRHTELIGPLREAIVDEPWREARRAQYALALYRAGRQAEALRAVQDYRSALADELGLDPSPDLQQLEHQILDHDPSLLSPSHQQHMLRGYELDEVVGEGAFSLVWRGVQPALGRTVAVKQIRAELANQPDFVRRFETEAQTVAALEHPYIVPLYDYWREPDSAYLVMRYVRGGSLESEVLQGGLDEVRLRRFVEQVGTALHVAHRMNVIHRDVKSANVLLDGDSNFYLTDFGIAFIGSSADDDLATSLSTGSPAYASPEQLRRQELDARTDIYGFGITLFEAATGRLPFVDAPTQAALVQRQLDEPVPKPSSIDPTVPRWVDEIVARATAKNPADRFSSMAELVAAVPSDVAGVAGHAGGLGTSTVIGELVNPFKALSAFREADAADFHGRERLVARLTKVLAQPGSAGRLLAVVGPSGSGKSSVVRSGLVPQLRRGAVAGSADWFITTMMPGSHPFDELESALSRVAVRQPGPLVEMMRSDDRGIARALNQILPDEDGELLVVIDQFEELFTHARDDEASKFIDGLIGAIREPRARLRVALTIRADFWDRPLRHPALAARLETAAVMVSPLAADELEAAIVEPARRQGASYEPGLVARVMADVGDEPGALPLLQYALTQLFDTNVSGLIRAGSYDEIGGLTGALAASAERTLTELTEPQQAATRRLLGRLVSLGEGTEDTRRRVRMSEFGDHRDTSAVIEAFGDARLLVFDHDPVTREPTVEIAHEALIRAWPRLRGWLDDDRDGLRIHRHLTETTSSWLASGRDAGELYRGGRLESTEAWAADHAADLNETEREFLAASAAVRDAEFEAERLHAEQQSRNNHRLRVLASIAVVVALLAAVAGVVALQQRSRADEQADEARVQAELAEVARQEAEANAADARDRAEEASNERDRADANADAAEAATVTADELRVAAEQQALVESTRRIGSLALSTIDDDIDLAVLLAIESASRAVESGREISEARQALFSTTAHHDIAARVALWDVDHTKHSLVAVAPSGTRFAALVAGEPASEVRHVEIRDLDGGSPVLVEIDDPTSVAWDPVGNRVLVGAEGGVIWAVDPATGAPTEFHRTGADWVKVWQMTDQWLVYQSGSGPVGGIATMTVASVADLRAVVEFERSIWLYVSPTGDHLVVNQGLSPGLYELPSGNLLAQVTIPAPMSWTADGDALLGITPDGVSFERLEVPSLSVSSIPTGLETAPTGLSLSPDGRLIAIGESDGAVRVFDADTFELGAEYFGHTDQVRAFDWTAAGDFLFSTDQPGGGDQVIVWDLDLAPRAPARVFPGSSDYPTWSAGHSDDERLVAVRRRDGSTSAELWSPGSVSTRFEGFQPVHARGADGAIVAASQRGVDGLATGFVVSDVSTGSVLLDVAGDLGAPLAISPDGQTVIATIGDGILFTVLNGGGSIEPEVAAIDVASGEVKWTLPGVRAFSETRTGHAAVFVDDGDAVVLATGSGLEWLEYDRPPELVAVATATGELLASRPLRSANAHLAASADGALLATADDRGGVSVLDVDAFLTGSRGPEIASTTLAAGTLPFGMAFSVDDGTLYTPAGFISPELLALDVDDGLALEWVLDTDLNESGTFPASQPTVDDGLIWFAAAATRSDQANRILEFGLVGIPTDLETYLAWARAIPTRDFTEAECEQLLGGPCADVLTRAD